MYEVIHHGLHALAAAPNHQASGSPALSPLQVVVLALLQGVAELFPISSLGHTVVAPRLLGWSVDQHAEAFLPFVVALHLGTGVALLLYFRREWAAIVGPMLRSVRRGALSDDPDERLGWLLAVGTVPAAILGVFFEKRVRDLFADPKIAAGFLIANGVILFAGERLRARATLAAAGAGGGTVSVTVSTRPAPRPLATLGWGKAVLVGAAQALALLPGISRSGVTMVAGLASGLSHEAAARFSFLLATPVILAAGVVEIPTLFGAAGRPLLGDALLGGVLAGLAAYASVRFLMRYFRVGRLDPFAYYCWIAGGLALLTLGLRG
jgi:undecaprenyl-diphosphatase